MTDQTTDTTADTSTDITSLPPSDRALIVLNSTKTERDLRAMVEEATAIVEVKDKTGREQAHRLGMKLRTARTTIEKTGKAARDDANAFARAVIDEQKRLIAITSTEEDRVLSLRDSFDAKVKAEEEAKAAAEAKRVAEIKEKIAGIRALPLALAGAPSAEIAAERDALDAFVPPEEVFGEFTEECREAMKSAILTLCDLYEQAVAREVAAAAVQAERERLDQAKREADAQLAAERAELEAERAAIAKEREELAALRAERAALEAEKNQVLHVDTFIAGTSVPEEVAKGALHDNLAHSTQLMDDNFGISEAALRQPGEHQRNIQSRAMLDAMPTAPAAELVATPEGDQGPAPNASTWKIRRAALATADQFSAMAQKVQACGFGSFANDLLGVAELLRNGDHDSALASADHAIIVEADNAMLDATVNCVEALSEEQAVAA